jgi:hypothetical protein
VGPSLRKFEKNATRKQSPVIKLYCLLAMTLLLRLVTQDCWLVVVLDQYEPRHGQRISALIYFCCSMFDARTIQGSENSRTYLVLINIYIKNLHEQILV